MARRTWLGADPRRGGERRSRPPSRPGSVRGKGAAFGRRARGGGRGRPPAGAPLSRAAGEVVAVEEDRYYLTSELAALIETVRAGMLGGRVYSPAELRDLTGLSRKYLIPFLEYCDRHGVTRVRKRADPRGHVTGSLGYGTGETLPVEVCDMHCLTSGSPDSYVRGESPLCWCPPVSGVSRSILLRQLGVAS